MQAEFNFTLILKCFVPKRLLRMQLFLLQTLTEIIPCSINYLECNDMLRPLPQRGYSMYRNNHNTKQNMLRAKKGAMCYERWTELDCWLRDWEKPYCKERHLCGGLLAVEHAKMAVVRRRMCIWKNSVSTVCATECVHNLKLANVLRGGRWSEATKRPRNLNFEL